MNIFEKYPDGKVSAIDMRRAYLRGIDGMQNTALSYNANSHGFKIDADHKYLTLKFIRENFPFFEMCEIGATVEEIAFPIADYIFNLNRLSDIRYREEREIGGTFSFILIRGFLAAFLYHHQALAYEVTQGDLYDNRFNKAYIKRRRCHEEAKRNRVLSLGGSS